MSYEVADTTAGLNEAMKILGDALKGMPDRRRFLSTYNNLARRMSMLIMDMDDGRAYFNEDGKAARRQKTAAKATKAAKAAVKKVA